MKQNLINFVNDPNDSKKNFRLAWNYYNINQTAIAFSYFHRCAEFTNNNLLASESLLWCSKCLDIQKSRSQKEYDMILHAISVSPRTPHGYYIKCLYHNFRNEMTECYTTASIALEIIDDTHKFREYIGYNDKKDILYQKALSGFNRGKLEESYSILVEYFPTSDILLKYPDSVKNNYNNKLVLKQEINQLEYSCVTQNIPEMIIIDNFYKDPDSVREYALNLQYDPPENHGAVGYRCERNRKIYNGTKEYFENIIQKSIKVHDKEGGWNYSTNGCFQWCPLNTSLVYHADAQEYAAIIFLTPNAPVDCGTSFFRHKNL